MKKRFISPTVITVFSLLFFVFLSNLCYAVTGDTRAINVRMKNNQGVEENVALYKGSYALLIGVSQYTAGWPLLESIRGEINQVESLLQGRGFKVVKILDPDSSELENGFRNFINKYGFEKDNRLLFFFSGHGHTRKNGRKGYLVPVDAPDPDQDLTGFLQKSLGMNQVLSWARDIEAKHALFLFDSCFSGTVFKQKARVSPPPHITRLTIEPVRQFITAGSAGETVPANSTFTPAFIDALRYGLADLNKDGYVSATELGLHLRTIVPAHTEQNPQFGTIRDYELSRGDFIFMTDDTAGPSTAVQQTGILKIHSAPVGASVFIGNNFQGTTPVTLTGITAGTHTLLVQKSGYKPETKKIQIIAGRNVTLSFPLIAEVSDGSLSINTNPAGTTVRFLNSNLTYSQGMRINAGTYNLVISKYGFISENVKINIKPNEDLHLDLTLIQKTAVATPDNRPNDTIQTQPEDNGRLRPLAPSTPSDDIDDGTLRRVESKPPSYGPKTNKVLHSGYVPNPIKKYINGLQSRDPKVKRKTAKTIYKKNIRHPELYQVVEDELLRGATVNLKDKHHIDAMAWLCNILGKTKDRKYKYTLTQVSRAKTHKKIKKYAVKNLRYLK